MFLGLVGHHRIGHALQPRRLKTSPEPVETRRVSADPPDFFASAPVRTLDAPPQELVAPTVARTKTRPGKVVVLGLVALIVAIVGVNVHAMRHGGGVTGTVDESGTTL